MNLKTPGNYCYYLSIYERQFSIAYHHLIHTRHEKDPPLGTVLGGMIKSLGHLVQSCEADLAEQQKNECFSLALDALIEDTYNCYKITISSLEKQIRPVYINPEKANSCLVDMNYIEFRDEYIRFKNLYKEANVQEDKRTEIGCNAAMKAYEDAIILGENLVNKIDLTKREKYERGEKSKNGLKQMILGVIPFKIPHNATAITIIVGVILYLIIHLLLALGTHLFGNNILPLIKQLFSG